MVGGAESLETSRIGTEGSLKYSIDICSILDEMKYGIPHEFRIWQSSSDELLIFGELKFSLDGIEQPGPRVQLFEGRLALNQGSNLAQVSFSCVQKHFLG